jgi:diguanylate cyclase
METRPAPLGGPSAPRTPAELAKAALRRLAMRREEPTPANFARAWREEGGEDAALSGPDRAALAGLAQRALPEAAAPEREQLVRLLAERRYDALPGLLGPGSGAAQGAAWADLIDKLSRQLERGSRQWTTGRKKESLQRVLTGSRSDLLRLQQRLRQLVGHWETDQPDDPAREDDPDAAPEETAAAAAADDAATPPQAAPEPAATSAGTDPDAPAPATVWPHVVEDLRHTVQTALPAGDPRAVEVGTQLRDITARLDPQGLAHELAAELAQACDQARRVLQHRHHLVDQLALLVGELTEGLGDFAEDDAWVRGQAEVMRAELEAGLSARGVRSVGDLLRRTREQQNRLRAERAAAREALKQMIHRMLQDIGELGEHTGRFQDSVGRYAEVIGQADSLESLAGAVREMVEESRAVHALVAGTQQRLHDEHQRASEMAERVRALEDEIRRLSDEVHTDQLTQVANRRGLLAQFENERARVERGGTALAVGLLDIDNFKKLNDTLGHQTGDEALKFLARRVGEALRPSDTLARYGGEEFVVLLPETPVEEAQVVLTRLQRTLSAELFMHEGRQTFVTFSAGVTPWRPGEPLEATLQRADEALYEAKRTGKNRTCIA